MKKTLKLPNDVMSWDFSLGEENVALVPVSTLQKLVTGFSAKDVRLIALDFATQLRRSNISTIQQYERVLKDELSFHHVVRMIYELNAPAEEAEPMVSPQIAPEV